MTSARTVRTSLGALALLASTSAVRAQQPVAPLAAWLGPVAATPHAWRAEHHAAAVRTAQVPAIRGFAAPSRMPLPALRAADGWKLGGVAVAALLVAHADRRGDAWARRPGVRDNDALQALARVGDLTGAAGSIGIGPAAWLLGRARGDSGMATLGLRTTEAVSASGVMIFAIKAITGRTRPYASADASPTRWDLFGGRRSDSTRSFASGHSAMAAAAAVTLAAEWRRQGRSGWSTAGPPLVYALASIAAGSRIVDRKHWLSDVVTGSGVGILNALLVRRWHDANPGSRLDRALLPR